jgi:chromosome segregation ATPase
MTPEQRRHEEDYYAAKRRYEDACYEKRCAENEISDIQNRRWHLINEINEAESEHKRFVESYDEIEKSIKNDEGISAGIKDAESKLTEASDGLLAIGTSSAASLKSLDTVFDEKNRSSKSSISSAFESLKRTKSDMSAHIETVAGKISQLKTELEDGKSRERYLSGRVSDCIGTMNSAAIDMAYHKRHMED